MCAEKGRLTNVKGCHLVTLHGKRSTVDRLRENGIRNRIASPEGR